MSANRNDAMQLLRTGKRRSRAVLPAVRHVSRTGSGASSPSLVADSGSLLHLRRGGVGIIHSLDHVGGWRATITASRRGHTLVGRTQRRLCRSGSGHSTITGLEGDAHGSGFAWHPVGVSLPFYVHGRHRWSKIIEYDRAAMRCSGHRAPVAVHAFRGPGRWDVRGHIVSAFSINIVAKGEEIVYDEDGKRY